MCGLLQQLMLYRHKTDSVRHTSSSACHLVFASLKTLFVTQTVIALTAVMSAVSYFVQCCFF